MSRGVLLDVARAKGLEILEPGYPITPDDLDAACALGGLTDRSRATWCWSAPGRWPIWPSRDGPAWAGPSRCGTSWPTPGRPRA